MWSGFPEESRLGPISWAVAWIMRIHPDEAKALRGLLTGNRTRGGSKYKYDAMTVFCSIMGGISLRIAGNTPSEETSFLDLSPNQQHF